jgi:membrane-anchored mycosin MYCP
VAGGLVLVAAPPAAAEEQACGDVQPKEPGEPPSETSRESDPLRQLRIAEVHEHLERRGVGPGAGVTVAVLDSGVSAAGGVTVAAGENVTGRAELQDSHGTTVAGLIAGDRRGEQLVGIAPDAEILDVRVYDAPDGDGVEADGVTADGIVAGLRAVLRHREVDVVNISLFVDQPDERIERLVDKLRRRDVVVVAAAGNRPASGEPLYDEFGEVEPGQDAVRRVFPAGYDSVVAVSAAVDDGSDAATVVLPNSATDVAAPVVGGVSVGVDGGTCTLDDVVTSWAAAEVSGVLALMRSLDPGATADQVVTRLTSTADGRTDVSSLLVGAGVVQPWEALVRPVTPADDGSLARATVSPPPPAVAPEPEPDTLAGSRRRALWWGVLGGGALLLALVLRPLLARGRR